MSTTEGKISLIPVWVIPTTVAAVDGPWVRFEGSQERLNLDDHDFKIGDHAEIRIRHVPAPIPRP